MARDRDTLAAAGVSVVAIAQASPKLLAAYLRENPTPVPMYSDPERSAYRAFGLGRVPLWRFFDPREIVRYVRHIIAGNRIRLPVHGEDVRQAGGDFVLNRTGTVVVSRPSRTPNDRPSVADILRLLDR